MRKTGSLLWLLTLLPIILAFRAVFLPGHLVWGDAPFFYSENLKELFSKPLLWDFRNDNFGAPQSSLVWLYLPTFLMGSLNQLFKFNSDILIRIIFYIPAILAGFWGTWCFLGFYFKDYRVKLIGSLFYVINTYFLTLMDGGQIGVTLAYGLFPVVVYWLISFMNNSNVRNFLKALFGLFVISNVDIRITILTIIFLICWLFTQAISGNNLKSKIKDLILLIISIVLVDLFWILPFFNGLNSIASSSGDSFISLLNSLVLFQPHFPINQFGYLLTTPFYFGLLPILILLGVFRKNFSIWAVMFLLFVFLAKGSSDPFGQLYSFLVNKVPFGVSFRDSSKFFIPAFLIASLLISSTLSSMFEKIKSGVHYLIYILILIYLLILIYPAILGRLTGTLSTSSSDLDSQVIYQTIDNDPNFSRSLWFPEKPPLGFADWTHPAISANSLAQERPFASMIDGTYDLFNFLHNPRLNDWYNLLGIKYIFYPPDPRKKIWSPQDIKEREAFLGFVNQTNLNSLDLPISFPGFINNQIAPHIFGQDKALFILGGEEIYQHLDNLVNTGTVFLEDGKSDPGFLFKVRPTDAVLVFENNDMALRMSFLKNSLIGPDNSASSEWKDYQTQDYLKWKYELQNNNIRNYDFDFGKGVATSSINGEKIDFNLKSKTGRYYLAVRSLEASGASLGITFLDKQAVVSEKASHFEWNIFGPFWLNQGSHSIEISNLGGFVALNTVGLISQEDFNQAKQEASTLENKFPVIRINQTSDWDKVNSLSKSYTRVPYQLINPTHYDLLSDKVNWIVFTDHYSNNWELNGEAPLPFYSMVNGFYIGGEDKKMDLSYTSQSRVDQGINLTLISIILILTICLIRNQRRTNKNLQAIHEDVPADHYDKGIKNNIFQRYWHTQRIKKLHEYMFKTEGRILDVGCHGGLLTQQIQKINPKSKIYGIDISPSAIQLAKKRLKNGVFKVANAHKLPFKDNYFNGVTCIEMMEHVEYPQKVLSEINRVLKKDGQCFILVPTDNPLFKIVWWLWQLKYREWEHAHVQSFTDKTLDRLVQKNGFTIDLVYTFNLGMLKIIKAHKDA